ncbi:MAG: guanylate kinase [Bacillota bacterium]|nr:guanylate kinase [Bacillota bacterium]
MTKREGFVVVLSGPSGAGKSTIAQAVVSRVPGLVFSVSATTRPPRPGEVHGRDYLFCTPEAFARMVDAGELTEWTSYCGHSYGTPGDELARLLAQGNDVVLDIDTNGAGQVRRKVTGAVLVFVVPPSLLDLERRIRARGCASDDELTTRLTQARIELAAARNYDYAVVNDDVAQAIEAVASIIRAERCRTARLAGDLVPAAEGTETVGHS